MQQRGDDHLLAFPGAQGAARRLQRVFVAIDLVAREAARQPFEVGQHAPARAGDVRRREFVEERVVVDRPGVHPREGHLARPGGRAVAGIAAVSKGGSSWRPVPCPPQFPNYAEMRGSLNMVSRAPIPPHRQKYSLPRLLGHARRHHEDWRRAWRDPAPKAAYDTVIVGGGGHGLATAYYLAREHGITDVAVIERGYLGGGNTGRNTTIVRSNYLRDASTRLYDFALELWSGLSRELNFNVMFSARGVLNLGHSLQDMRDIERRVNANRLNGRRRRRADDRRGTGTRSPHALRTERPLPGPRRVLAAPWRRRAPQTRSPGATPARRMPSAWTSCNAPK